MRGSSSHPKAQEANRYRTAAEDALRQLDWAIRYLHGIRKEKVAAVLAKNRAGIRRNLMDREDEQPLPARRTKET